MTTPNHPNQNVKRLVWLYCLNSYITSGCIWSSCRWLLHTATWWTVNCRYIRGSIDANYLYRTSYISVVAVNTSDRVPTEQSLWIEWFLYALLSRARRHDKKETFLGRGKVICIANVSVRHEIYKNYWKILNNIGLWKTWNISDGKRRELDLKLVCYTDAK